MYDSVGNDRLGAASVAARIIQNVPYGRAPARLSLTRCWLLAADHIAMTHFDSVLACHISIDLVELAGGILQSCQTKG